MIMLKTSTLPMGVGLIGTGIVSESYLKSYAKDPRTNLLGLSDINEEILQKTANTYNVRIAVTDYRELLGNDEVDLVIITTPHYLHHPMVIEALDVGKDVICEKPLALNAKQAQEMIDKAKAVNRQLFVGLNWRCVNAFRTVEKVMHDGKIGRPFMAKISYMGHEVERLQDENHWKGSKDKSGGGALLDGGYHAIDIMNMLFGLPQDIKGFCGKYVVKTFNKCEDNAILLFDYSADMIGEVSASFTTKLQGSKQSTTLGIRLEVYGTEGSIWTEYRTDTDLGWQMTLISDDKEIQIPLQTYSPNNLALHFVDCLVNGAKPIVTAEDALQVHKIIDAVYAQSATV